MGGLSVFMKQALSGKHNPGKPKAAPTPSVQTVQGMATTSAKDAERHGKPENLPTVSDIPASGFGPGIKVDQPSKKGIAGIPGVYGMAVAKNSMKEETSADYYEQRETILERIDIKLKERKNG